MYTTDIQEIYHIAQPQEWTSDAIEAGYLPSTYKDDGFIHCCTSDQIEGVLSRYYTQAPALALVKLNYLLIAEHIKWEPSPNGMFFPHLFASITTDMILSVSQITYSRDRSLVSIRPVLALHNSQANTEEFFQNTSLRPILKLQHNALITLFENYVLKCKKTLDPPHNEEKINYLIHELSFTNRNFVHTLTGMVVGMMTQDELATYLSNEGAFRRRITTMAKERIKSHFLR